MLLITLVRRAICLASLKMLRPTDPSIEALRCSSWDDLKTHYPHVSVGQLERVINAGALSMFRRLAAIRRCRECNRPVSDEDCGQWVTSMCAGCEGNAVTIAVATLNAPAANDVAYGYYRLQATEEHGEMYCPPCLRGLAIDPHGHCSDWTPLDAATAANGHCDACGESLDDLTLVVAVLQ